MTDSSDYDEDQPRCGTDEKMRFVGVDGTNILLVACHSVSTDGAACRCSALVGSSALDNGGRATTAMVLLPHADDSCDIGSTSCGDDRLHNHFVVNTMEIPTDEWEDNQTIYDRLSPKICAFLLNKVPSYSNTEVEDLMHETFSRFIGKRRHGPIADRHGRPFRSVESFLYGVARNVLLEHIKRSTKITTRGEIMEQALADMSQGVSTLMSLEEKKRVAVEALRQLPFHMQIVIECCCVDNMPYQDVADLLDVPLGTIATWRRRGGDRLRANYQRLLRSEPVSAAMIDDDDRLRRELREFSWFDSRTGRIDHWELIWTTTKTHSRRGHGVVPDWFSELEVPPELPGADPAELSALARATWEAWVAAGRPTV